MRLADHGDALFEAFSADAEGRMWTYMAVGPFGTDRAAFDTWIAQCEASQDPLFFAVVDQAGGRAVGYASYLRIEPAVGVIEVGHITLSPALQRTAMATETMYLMMARVFEELGYRRYEWKCDSLNAPSRIGGQAARLSVRGHFPSGDGLQGPQPRHRVVLDPRHGMAGAQGGVPGLAGSVELRRRGSAAGQPVRA